MLYELNEDLPLGYVILARFFVDQVNALSQYKIFSHIWQEHYTSMLQVIFFVIENFNIVES